MHPLRLAEDIVVTDLISRGRLVLGMGLGWRAEEFDAFELDPKKRVSAMEHRVTLLKEAFRPGTLVGEHRVGIHPKPTKDGGPPILMGGDVKATLERAARIADGVYLSAYGPETLRERLKDMPSDAKPMIVTAQNPVFVWDGPEDPWDVVMEWLPYWAWKMTDMVEARHRAEPAPMPETGPPPERVERYRKGMIIGRPEQVLEKLKEFKGLISPDGDLVARAYYPGMPTEVQHRVVRLLGELARELK
jgi:alkanesulfonate monooxygenase SsuD/methylene tetrahydromethanopterin reductase-like flavin-dependent oxidoreductase (luciferase family)